MAATRYNSGKPQWGLVVQWTLIPMVKVLEFGAAKYAPDNWKKGLNREEILESIKRHLDALFDGQEFDEKDSPTDISHSGLHHIGHIMCNCMFYFFHWANGTFTKERNVEYGAEFRIQPKKVRKKKK